MLFFLKIYGKHLQEIRHLEIRYIGQIYFEMKSKKNDLSQIIAIFYNLNQTKERYFGQIYFEMKLKKNDLSQIEISLVFFFGGVWLVNLYIYLFDLNQTKEENKYRYRSNFYKK